MTSTGNIDSWRVKRNELIAALTHDGASSLAHPYTSEAVDGERPAVLESVEREARARLPESF